MEEQAVALAHDYLEKFMLEYTNYLSSKFIREALDVLRNVRACSSMCAELKQLLLQLVSSWESHQWRFSSLEKVLVSYLSSLAYPLSLILME